MPAAADPIGEAEFAAMLAPLGPFGAAHQVVAAVSGGADSMALAWLLRRWGEPVALVIDHGLRDASSAEAALTMARLLGMGIPARLTRLQQLHPGPGLAARARAARYGALLDGCRSLGRPDLFVAHHRQDQAETVLLRTAAGSGPAGRAGMAAVSWRDDARILRPLLAVPPARLRATLAAAGLPWVDDPTNADPATARGALRRDGVPDAAARAAVLLGEARRAAEQAVAQELAGSVAIAAAGHARIDGPLSPEAWSALVWTVSGRDHPPSAAAVRRLRARGCGTLHGVVVRGGLVAREPDAARRAAAVGPERWDGRFTLRGGPPGAVVGALAADAARLRRRSSLPSVVLRSLPALRQGTDLLAVPHLAYPDGQTCLSVQADFRPPRPLAGAPFRPGHAIG